MSYLEDIRKEILKSGVTRSPEYAQKKADDYQKTGKINYALYKSAKTKDEAQKYYAASQSAYEKGRAWQEVVKLLLSGLRGR